jgi:PncC family amidohydrolase
MPTVTAQEIEFTRVDEALVRQACDVMDLLTRNELGLVTAESCTGGLLAAVLSEAPGASQWLHGGFVTYTAQNKTATLGVSAKLIQREGAVSEAVARAMAEGALARSPADMSVAITGARLSQDQTEGLADLFWNSPTMNRSTIAPTAETARLCQKPE